MVMATAFTHEWSFQATPCCPGVTTVTTNQWLAILQGITNNLAAYNPIFVTLDYASQYVRATRTSRLVSSAFDPASGQVTASLLGEDGSGYFRLCLCWRGQCHQFQLWHRAGVFGVVHQPGGGVRSACDHQRALEPDQ